MAENKRCARLLEEIMALLDDELDDASRRRAEEHLRQCPRCEACRAILSRSRALCGERLPLTDEHRQALLRQLEEELTR